VLEISPHVFTPDISTMVMRATATDDVAAVIIWLAGLAFGHCCRRRGCLVGTKAVLVWCGVDMVED
jgi:hypothetical protein